jgi:tetratricopeptide (TPR) repeat protein
MLIRATLLSIALLSQSAVAQKANESASLSIDVAPMDPVKKRANEIDKLFGKLHQKGDPQAAATIDKIWTLWGANESPMAEVLLGQSIKAMRDGAFETSEKMLDEVIGSYPNYVEPLNQRAMLYYNMNRFDEAMDDLEAVLAEEPRHFGALVGKAAVLQATGKAGKAAEALREAIAVNPYLETAKAALKQLEHDNPNI